MSCSIKSICSLSVIDAPSLAVMLSLETVSVSRPVNCLVNYWLLTTATDAVSVFVTVAIVLGSPTLLFFKKALSLSFCFCCRLQAALRSLFCFIDSKRAPLRKASLSSLFFWSWLYLMCASFCLLSWTSSSMDLILNQ